MGSGILLFFIVGVLLIELGFEAQSNMITNNTAFTWSILGGFLCPVTCKLLFVSFSDINSSSKGHIATVFLILF